MQNSELLQTGVQIPLFSNSRQDIVLLEDHVIVRSDEARWKECIHELADARYFGFDIETYGFSDDNLGALDPWEGRIRLMSIALPSGKVMLLDLGGWNDCRDEALRLNREALEALRKALENRDQIVVGHNLAFDALFVMCAYGWKVNNVRDTELMSQVLWAGLGDDMGNRIPHSLKEVCWRLGLGKLDKSIQKSDFGWDISNAQRNYSACDALIAVKVWQRLGKLIKEEGLQHSTEVECRALPAFVHMMYHGLPVDVARLESLIREYKRKSTDIVSAFLELFPNVNPLSQRQVMHALNERFEFSLTSIGDADLSGILEPSEAKLAAKAILDFRRVRTQLAYLEGILLKTRLGRVRTKFRQIGPTGMGRSTSKSPNLQNPANDSQTLRDLGLDPVRSIFRAKPGHKMIVVDLSQAHSRIAASVSKDPKLGRAYRHNLDIHSITASGLAKQSGLGPEWTPSNIALWRKSKTHPNHLKAQELRQLSKPVFYGSLNLQGAKALQATARTAFEPVHLTEDEAKEGIATWRKIYAGLFRFQMAVIRKANTFRHRFPEFECRYPWLVGKMFGEVRGLTGRRMFLLRREYGGRTSVKGPDCVSMVWMSTEADAIKEGLARVYEEILNHPEWGAKICNFCHDEVDLECREEFSESVAEAALRIVTEAFQEVIPDTPAADPTTRPGDLICDSWVEKG